MRNWFTTSLSVALTSGLAFGLGAQSGAVDRTAASSPQGGSSSITKQAYQVRSHADGRVSGGGADYHVEFEKGSMHFKPALGDEVATDRFLRLTLRSIHRGDRQIHRANGLRVSGARVNGKTVTYDRNGVREQYEVRPSGVKQNFVFPTRPAGQGDLVVRLCVQSDLLASPGEDLERLAFRTTTRAGAGGVDIGVVIGIDARGRRVRGHMDYDGEHLDLVLPEQFVQTAAYPLTLDPPIAPRRCVCVTNDDSQADIAYDVTHNVYMVVWTRRFSSTNIVIRAVRVNGTTGALIGSFVSITDQNTGKNTNPSIANVNSRDRFVVAWERENRVTAARHQDIRARSVPALSGTMGAIETVAGLPWDETGVAVGGETTLADDECVMVYRDATAGVQWKEVTVQPDGTLRILTSRTQVVSQSTSAPTGDPSICKGGGPGRAFLVAWPVRWGCAFRAVSANSAILSDVSGSASRCVAITCDGDGRAFYVAVESDGTFANIGASFYTLPSSASAVMVFGGGWTHPSPGTAGQPAIASLGDRPVVAYVRGALAVASTLSPTCRPDWGRFYNVGATSGTHSRPRIASSRSGGSLNDRAMIVSNSRLSGQNDIQVTLWQGVVGGTAVPFGPPGCAGGGQQTVTGKIALGERITWQLSGADRGAAGAWLAVSAPQIANFSRCGSCQFLLGPLIAAPIRNGAASLDYRLECDPVFLGGELVTQWWAYRPNGPGVCPTVPGLAASNTLRLTIRD